MTDDVVIITGGGRGIGRAIALSLAAQGKSVVVAARTRGEVESVASEIAAGGGRALAFDADVTDETRIAALRDAALERFGRITVLVNCAGMYGAIGKTWELETNDWVRAINTNLIGTFICCRAIIPVMIGQGGGKIVNVAGGGATMPLARLSSYACSKAGIVRLTETLAQELEPHNVRVNAVAPGTVDTQIQDQLLAAGEKAGAWYEPIRALRASGGGVPMDDITTLIVRMLSPEFDALNGRLISARYDDWKTWDAGQIAKIMSSSMFKLCRMDEHSIGLSRP